MWNVSSLNFLIFSNCPLISIVLVSENVLLLGKLRKTHQNVLQFSFSQKKTYYFLILVPETAQAEKSDKKVKTLLLNPRFSLLKKL